MCVVYTINYMNLNPGLIQKPYKTMMLIMEGEVLVQSVICEAHEINTVYTTFFYEQCCAQDLSKHSLISTKDNLVMHKL